MVLSCEDTTQVNKNKNKCVNNENDGGPSVQTLKSQVGLIKAERRKKKPNSTQLGEVAKFALRGLSARYSARSCALALQVVGHTRTQTQTERHAHANAES